MRLRVKAAEKHEEQGAKNFIDALNDAEDSLERCLSKILNFAVEAKRPFEQLDSKRARVEIEIPKEWLGLTCNFYESFTMRIDVALKPFTDNENWHGCNLEFNWQYGNGFGRGGNGCTFGSGNEVLYYDREEGEFKIHNRS